ncbi:MAG: bifunctional metallophosphatase/5'-nucleotidase, partial [Bacteroidales bacterium]|nr:bifunctional metallophosphatase/5'-nucleotidase [Bacteroidales bacterium]
MRKLIYIALALALAACQPAQSLVILHVNDTHSHFEPVRSGEEAGLGVVIERAAYIDSVRAAEGAENVLLLHAGD